MMLAAQSSRDLRYRSNARPTARTTCCMVQHFNLPADYWDKYPDRIAAVDAAKVQAAAKKYVDLNHMQWVSVGDVKQIREALSKYGAVTVVDVAGKSQPN